MAFEAKNNYVFLILDDKEDEVLESGLVLLTSFGLPPAEGKVVAAGEGKRDDHGRLIPNPCKVGDTVHFEKLQAKGVKIEGVEYVYVDADYVNAILEEEQ
jgi:chaperonin GroES